MKSRKDWINMFVKKTSRINDYCSAVTISEIHFRVFEIRYLGTILIEKLKSFSDNVMSFCEKKADFSMIL